MPEQLNFVFILVDDMGWRDAACYGSDFYETPSIDRLALDSMLFTSAYAAAPVCAPTRASIMTGKVPARHRITNYKPNVNAVADSRLQPPTFVKWIPPDEVTIAQALRNQGYATACVGKWDLGEKPSYPEERGFDVNVAGHAGGSARSHFYPGWLANTPLDGKPGDYLADRLADEAEQFIETNRDGPFFLYFSHYAVHLPLEAKQDYIRKYEAKLKPGQAQNNPVYAAMLQSVDETVGRVMDKLDELGIADRTVVILASDNGGLHISEQGFPVATSNAPLREGKGHLYEGGIRVPMIVRWPGVVEPGSRCDVPVSSIDFYPTMLTIAGAEDLPGRVCDGESIVPLLTNGGELTRDALYWHYPHYSNQGGYPSCAIRAGSHKLIRFFEDDRVELYDLDTDLSESHNLEPEMPELAAGLRGKLDKWLEAVDAPMAVRRTL